MYVGTSTAQTVVSLACKLSIAAYYYLLLRTDMHWYLLVRIGTYCYALYVFAYCCALARTVTYRSVQTRTDARCCLLLRIVAQFCTLMRTVSRCHVLLRIVLRTVAYYTTYTLYYTGHHTVCPTAAVL